MKQLTGYKVVRCFENGAEKIYESWLQWEEAKESTVQYKIDKWVKPREGCGDLMVCTDLREAKELLCGANQKIFRCFYERSKERMVGFKDKPKFHVDEDNDGLYDGFDCALRVMITEEVTDEGI